MNYIPIKQECKLINDFKNIYLFKVFILFYFSFECQCAVTIKRN